MTLKTPISSKILFPRCPPGGCGSRFKEEKRVPFRKLPPNTAPWDDRVPSRPRPAGWRAGAGSLQGEAQRRRELAGGARNPARTLPGGPAARLGGQLTHIGGGFGRGHTAQAAGAQIPPYCHQLGTWGGSLGVTWPPCPHLYHGRRLRC